MTISLHRTDLADLVWYFVRAKKGHLYLALRSKIGMCRTLMLGPGLLPPIQLTSGTFQH